jgi:filamentous hemagglutinin
LDWSRISARTGGNAAEHVTLNHGLLSLTKPNQGVFYGNPVSTIEDAWTIAQRNGLKPVTVGNRDIYVVSRPNSGYAGGIGGQLENYNHVTIITEAGTSKVVTGYPSGGTPPLELLKNDLKILSGGK